MTFFGTCEGCGQAVTSSPAFPVEGWEVPREQGGTNHILGRRRVPNRVRHATCLPPGGGTTAMPNAIQEAML